MPTGVAHGTPHPDDVGDVWRTVWLVFLTLACVMLFRRVVEQSIFFDGLIYAGMARNLAEGVGSAWDLQFSRTMFPTYTEHPPLNMWIQSLLYRVFGDTIVVEKSFSLAMALLGAMILTGIWREINRDDPKLRAATPLVLILALLGGRTAWAYANNMLENLLFVFTGVSIYLTVRSYRLGHRTTFPARLPYVLGSGLALAAAVLTKGPVGLFPLAAPGLYWLVFRRPGLVAAVTDTLMSLATLLAVVAIAMASQEARTLLAGYLEHQLFASLSGARGRGGGGLSAVGSLFEAFLVPAAITGIIVGVAYAAGRWRGHPLTSFVVEPQRLRRALFFALVGASASLPILVSPRVYRFYFNPSVPYYAAGLAVLCAPVLMALLASVGASSRLWLRRAALAAFAVSLGFVGWSFGKPGRDASMLADIRRIGGYVCQGEATCDEIVQTCPPMWYNYQFDSYMERLYKISVARQEDGPGALPTRFAITVPDCPAPPADSFGEVDLGLEAFRLFARRPTGGL